MKYLILNLLLLILGDGLHSILSGSFIQAQLNQTQVSPQIAHPIALSSLHHGTIPSDLGMPHRREGGGTR